MSIYRSIFFVFICLLSLSSHSQNDSLRLNKQEWQELSEGIDYTEHYKEQEREKKTQQAETKPYNSEVRSGNLNYVFYVIVAIIIGLIIYWVFKNLNPGKNLAVTSVTIDSMEHIEENIHEVNLEDLLKEALLAKNYKIALRLNFLIIIKLLSQKEKINWAKEKTNWEYYYELKEKILADQFKNIIQSFEIFWYGEYLLTEKDYFNTEPFYKALQNKLSEK